MDQLITLTGGCCVMKWVVSMNGGIFHSVLEVISTLPVFLVNERVPLLSQVCLFA